MTAPFCTGRGTECNCLPSECRSAPTTPPMVGFSVRVRAAAMFIGLSVIAIPVAYAALARADESFRVEALSRQEVSHVVLR